jgi:hypothetical protein
MRSCLPSGRITCRTRLPFEHHVFTVVAAVTLVRPEDDSDLHLVLQERGYDMIAEAPGPVLRPPGEANPHREMAVARRHVRLCTRARVTGVGFFDLDHGQTGVAPNAIELHPIPALPGPYSLSQGPAGAGPPGAAVVLRD